MGKKVRQGIDDLYTWCINHEDYGKELLEQWVGIDIDGNTLDIHNVPFGSSKKVNWKCNKCNNEWNAFIYQRTRSKTMCPKCRIHERYYNNVKNNLYDWCINHNEIGNHIMSMWTGKCKDGTFINMRNISAMSSKELAWRCDTCGNLFNAIVSDITRLRTKCNKCKTKYVNEENNLYNWCINNNFGKKLLKQWVGKDSNGNCIDINKIASGSNIKVLWKCDICGNEWLQSPNKRIYGETNCIHCARKDAIVYRIKNGYTPFGNRLIIGENDLYTYCIHNKIGDKLIEEWTGLDEHNNNIDIYSITYGSNKKMKWLCSRCGNEFIASIHNRACNESGCPSCTIGTSFSEQYIYCALAQEFSNIKNRFRTYIEYNGNKQLLELDIIIKDNRINDYKALAIEYSPTYWHKDKVEKDQFKIDICSKFNVNLVQIVDDSYDSLEVVYSKNLIQDTIEKLKRNEKILKLNKIIKYILSTLNIESNIDFNIAYENAINRLNEIKS